MLGLYKILIVNHLILLLGMMIPLFWGSPLRLRSSLSTQSLISMNLWVFLPFSGMMLLHLTWMEVGTSAWDQIFDEWWIPLYRLIAYPLIFLLSAKLGSAYELRNHFKILFCFIIFFNSLTLIMHANNPQFFDALYEEKTHQAFGFIGQRNTAALQMVLLTSVALNFNVFRFRDILTLTACIISAIFTLSRMGMIFSALLSAFFILMTFRNRTMTRFKIAAIVAGMSIFLFIVISDIVFVLPQMKLIQGGDGELRINLLKNKGMDALVDTDRISLIDQSLESFLKSPIIGHGSYFHVSPSFGQVGPHNEFLRYAVDFGILGVVVYSLFLVGGIITFWKRGFAEGQIFILLLACAGFFSHNLTESLTVIILYGMLLGWSASLAAGQTHARTPITYHNRTSHHQIPRYST